MKKLISMLISISMIFTMLPTLTFAEEETADVYTSTEKYSENTNGTWDNGVWSAEVYSASNGTYTTLTNKNGDDYCDAYPGHWDGFLANGKKLQTTAANSSDSVVRAFTAPKDGIVTISQCREFQESGGNPLAIRITLTKSGETTTIWPEAGIDMAVNKDNGYRDVGGWNFVTQRAVNDIEVSKGDIIRFEMKKQNSTDGSGVLNWENTVTYKHYTQAPITYSSLDNYSNAESNATWNNGMWTAQTLSGTTYTNMAGKNGDEYCFGWTGNWDGFLAGGKKLQTAAGNSSDSAVRTFTAPRTGIVNIEKTKFQESNNGKAGVRIIIQRTGEETAETLWPDEKIDPNITDGHISFGNWNWVTQREINGISVKKGDIIRFEMKKLNGSDERSVINWENKITYTAYAEALPVPQISINYADEKLTGFAVNEKYTIGDNEITSADGSLDIDSAWFNTTLSIVMKGDSITNEDSETQSLEIPERPAAPTETDITVTHPAVINGTGSVSGVSGTEYKAAESEEWTACEGNEITGLAAGTYNIRKKATDTSFKSDIYSFTINAFEPSKEATPEIAVDYANEKLTGFGEGSYTVNGGAVTPENGSLAIASYMDTTVKIIKKGNGTTTTDSEEQSLIIPARPTAPTVTAVDESSVGANNGKITDVTDAMEYKLSSAQEWTPVGNGVTEITNLAPGSYNVRYKATASSFASLSNTVAINAKGVQEPTVTVPTLSDVIYTDGMKLSDISLAGIQIPAGDTEGEFTWKTPNMLVNAGDNQSFDAVFTPADTTNFKIKELQIPVNIKPATITGITVTGYEGNADGQTHGVTVMGARAGDTVTYKVDDGEFASDAPSYTEVCEHTVTVKVVRANYTDFIAEPVTVKITAEPKPSPSPTVNPQTPKIYISTAKFNTDKGDGTWQRGIWAAQRCEKDVYENLTVVKNNGYSSDKTNGIVSADKFITSNEATEERLVRVFTAPMDGTVTINKTDITGGEFLTSARILKADKNNNVTTLMPKDLNAWPGTGFSYIYEWTPVTQEEIKDIAIEKGERLLFEIVKTDDTGSSEIKWTNTVTYTSYDETTLDPEPTPTPTPKPTIAPPLEQGTYKSSHNFIPEDGNGIWESVWSAEIYNSTDRTYTDAKTKYKDGYAKNNTDEKQPVVYGNKMRVSGADIPDMHPVRKFTVPKDGSLRILQSEITHKTWEEVQYNIKLNDTVIWTKAYSDSGAKLIQPEQRLQDVKAGDVIRFEMILKEGTSYGYEQLWENTILEWDGTEPTPTPPIIPTPTPTVKPTPEPTLNPDLGKTSYRASDSWSMEKNGDDVWRWQSYKTETKVYEDLPQKMESNMNMGDDWDDGPVWIAGDDWRWAAIGKYTMRASVDPGDPTAEETRGDFKAHRDYPVRTFTSPKNGTVSIHASSDKIFAKDNMYGTHIRIMCQRADGSKPIQIFPNAEEMAWLNIKGEYNFEPIEFELNAGDKLMFENAFIWKEGGYSPWNTYVRWDPIVEYKTINPKLMSITPENGAENVPLNAEHVLSYDGALNSILKEKVSVYEVNSEGESIESDAVCSSIAVEGSAIKFVVDGLKPYTKYEVKVDGICYSGFDNKNEKSETITFTTGPEVNVGEAKYANGKVSVPVNNPYKENKTATLIAAVCKGTESKYSIEKTYYITRRDIGANDVIETEAELPSGSDYFIKAIVMEDMQKVRAYAPASIIRR